MISYQHIQQLKQLYLLKATGTRYVDPIVLEASEVENHEQLPKTLDNLHRMIDGCHLCDLSKTRTKVQVSHGKSSAPLMIVGDFPTFAEDSEGAYAGKSGEILQNMITKVLNIDLNDVYFTHAVKCIGAGGKAPSQSEIMSCRPFLLQQIEILSPKLIVLLGEMSYNYLTQDKTDFNQIRGKILPYNGFKLFCMDSPKFLARNPSFKNRAMQDLNLIKKFLCE